MTKLRMYSMSGLIKYFVSNLFRVRETISESKKIVCFNLSKW